MAFENIDPNNPPTQRRFSLSIRAISLFGMVLMLTLLGFVFRHSIQSAWEKIFQRDERTVVQNLPSLPVVAVVTTPIPSPTIVPSSAPQSAKPSTTTSKGTASGTIPKTGPGDAYILIGIAGTGGALTAKYHYYKTTLRKQARSLTIE